MVFKKTDEKNLYFFILKISLNFLVIFFVLTFIGCCAYSFTGSNAPEHIKSVAIPMVDDRSGFGEAGLREYVTSSLTQKFIDDNTLQVTDRSNANSVLDCVISSITDIPGVITANEVVAKRKITISISVTYKDLVKRKTVFEKVFSNSSFYAEAGDISVRRAAINDAVDKVTQDILLDTVSGW